MKSTPPPFHFSYQEPWSPRPGAWPLMGVCARFLTRRRYTVHGVVTGRVTTDGPNRANEPGELR